MDFNPSWQNEWKLGGFAWGGPTPLNAQPEDNDWNQADSGGLWGLHFQPFGSQLQNGTATSLVWEVSRGSLKLKV